MTLWSSERYFPGKSYFNRKMFYFLTDSSSGCSVNKCRVFPHKETADINISIILKKKKKLID